MSKEQLAQLAKIEWTDDNFDGWPSKKCTISLGICAQHKIDNHFYKQNEAEVKRYIQNECLDRLHRDVRDSVFPEVKEVASELEQLSIMIAKHTSIYPETAAFFKGEPLWHILHEYAMKLTE